MRRTRRNPTDLSKRDCFGGECADEHVLFANVLVAELDMLSALAGLGAIAIDMTHPLVSRRDHLNAFMSFATSKVKPNRPLMSASLISSARFAQLTDIGRSTPLMIETVIFACTV
jgi:hypothetical protein